MVDSVVRARILCGRWVLVCAGTCIALAATLVAPRSAHAQAMLESRVDAAFEFLFPVYESARLRYNAIDNPLPQIRPLD